MGLRSLALTCKSLRLLVRRKAKLCTETNKNCLCLQMAEIDCNLKNLLLFFKFFLYILEKSLIQNVLVDSLLMKSPNIFLTVL